MASFQGDVILWAARCYCRYGVSYRDLEQMIGERGVPVDHSTLSIAGFKNMHQQLKTGGAGIGVVRNRRTGGSMKPM